MKKIQLIIAIVLFLNFTTGIAFAGEIIGPNYKITSSSIEESKITKSDIFNFFANYYEGKIPESYKYIDVKFLGIQKNSKLENSLKKLVYLDLIDNVKVDLLKDEGLNAWGFYKLSEKILKVKITNNETKKELLNRKTTKGDIKNIYNQVSNDSISTNKISGNKDIKQKIAIFENVYETLVTGHYDKEQLDKGEIIDSAIVGLTRGLKDKHTVYFPPIESKNFSDSLSGDYEGIGAYVDMEKPGAVRIVSPIPGSPSEKAGIKGGDLVIKVDGKSIEKDNSLKEVITWIKGPAGTTVNLTINRDGKILEIKVVRERIIITDIESELLNPTTYYIQIKSFGEHVTSDFKKSITKLSEHKDINKIIIDLRNNGGGYLSEVAEMLSYFVEEGKKTAVVKYHDSEKTYISKGYELVNFSKYKLVILQNSGTASASEILIGTLKDYYEDIEIIGEKTYGKGSVQVMKGYTDGSLLKYTIAKWFTGLTETGIDGVGINPTIELEFDLENYKENGFDNQLDKAIFIN